MTRAVLITMLLTTMVLAVGCRRSRKDPHNAQTQTPKKMQGQDHHGTRHPRDNDLEAAFTDILPKGWKLIGISSIQAPSEWKRTRGKDGVKIALKNPNVTVKDEMV